MVNETLQHILIYLKRLTPDCTHAASSHTLFYSLSVIIHFERSVKLVNTKKGEVFRIPSIRGHVRRPLGHKISQPLFKCDKHICQNKYFKTAECSCHTERLCLCEAAVPPSPPPSQHPGLWSWTGTDRLVVIDTPQYLTCARGRSLHVISCKYTNTRISLTEKNHC